MCAHAAFEEGAYVLYFSLELARHEVGERLLCARSGIDGYRLRTGMGLGNGEMTALAKAFNGMIRSKRWLWVDDTPGRNALQVIEQARRIKGEYPVGLVAIDYVSLLGDDGACEGQEERIASASRHFKTLARELNVPILAVSQVGRAVERREDRRPRMSDLRGSGAIEEDADVVFLLYRPDYYDANDQPGIAELIVAKNRNGPTETVKLIFQKSLARFETLAAAPEPLDEGSPF
jgi:replicative DNA helicase